MRKLYVRVCVCVYIVLIKKKVALSNTQKHEVQFHILKDCVFITLFNIK